MPSAACFTILHSCVCVCVCVAANGTRKIPCDATCAVRINAEEWMEWRVSQSLRKMQLACVERALSVLFLASVSKRSVMWDDVPRNALGV